MIYATDFALGENQQELLQIDPISFPYACYYRELNSAFGPNVPFHWHKAFEIDYLLEGSLTLYTAKGTYLLHPGDLCFLNSEVIHSLRYASSNGPCKFYAHLFPVSFLSGQYSLMEQKYFAPIIGNPAMDVCLFSAEATDTSMMSALFMDLVRLDTEGPSGYEFMIRAGLGQLWFHFFSATTALHQKEHTSQNEQIKRLKQMLLYIQEHYMEKILLSDIASTVSVSPQECMRCFRKYLRQSPIEYLTEYRIRMAAGRLSSSTESITEISENCGFSSNSYFTKVFHDTMHCTPKEYRSRNQ